MKFKAVVFDLFGTVVYRRVKTNFSRGLNFPKNSKSILMSSEFKTVQDMCTRFKLTPEKDVLTQADGLIKSDIENICVMFDAVRSINYAKEQGYKVFALSDVATPWAEAFKKLDISKMFDDLFLSCETGNLKLSENSYKQILEKYNLSPDEILIVGDTPEVDVHGPWSNGINGVYRGQDMVQAIKQAEIDYNWIDDSLTINDELIFKLTESSNEILGFDYRNNRQYKFTNKTIAKYAFESSINNDRTFLEKYDYKVMNEVNL